MDALKEYWFITTALTAALVAIVGGLIRQSDRIGAMERKVDWMFDREMRKIDRMEQRAEKD